jgi:hypothetical protein
MRGEHDQSFGFSATRWVALATAGLSSAVQLGLAVPQASATAVDRAQGRCTLEQQYTTGNNFSKLFDGQCSIVHKQGNSLSLVDLTLNDGQDYQFIGRLDNLSIHTNHGIYPVRHRVDGDSEIFTWGERGERMRLSVKTDTRYDPQVSHGTAGKVAGSLIGAVAGAFIGGLLSGGKSPSASTPSSQPSAGTTVARLSDLVGAKAGQAENTINQRGYRFVKGVDGGYTYWLEGRTNYCVTILTEQGRYQSIVYAGGPSDCQK